MIKLYWQQKKDVDSFVYNQSAESRSEFENFFLNDNIKITCKAQTSAKMLIWHLC